MKFFLTVASVTLLLLSNNASAFTVHTNGQKYAPAPARLSPLFMGRAAAVRAVTKAKTDGRKAKINAIFGKRIIMAVKNGGGSADMEANTMLRDCVKQAKSNSVPVENIQRAIKRATEGFSGDFVESTFEACKWIEFVVLISRNARVTQCHVLFLCFSRPQMDLEARPWSSTC
jgi:Transcriptional regulator